MTLTKLQSEAAALRDSLDKMGALSEGLAKDKVELNRVLLQVWNPENSQFIILTFTLKHIHQLVHIKPNVHLHYPLTSDVYPKVETDKAELSERKREVEIERTAAREELVHLQQELLDVMAEKRALEATHIHLQEARGSLEAELCMLQRERTLTLEQLAQVSLLSPAPGCMQWFTAFSCTLMYLVVILKKSWGEILDASAMLLNTLHFEHSQYESWPNCVFYEALRNWSIEAVKCEGRRGGEHRLILQTCSIQWEDTSNKSIKLAAWTCGSRQ